MKRTLGRLKPLYGFLASSALVRIIYGHSALLAPGFVFACGAAVGLWAA